MDAIDRLTRVRRAGERLVVGLMSGMSMDGLDIALVRIREGDRADRPKVTLLEHATRPYPPELTARLRAAIGGSARQVCTLSFELAETWAEAVLAFLSRVGVAPADVHVLGSHGQTLDHVPRGGDATPSTLQVGDGDVLAHRTGILTVSDFRCRDIAAGGEGAPLVPYADWVLYARPGDVVACQNLGHIANVSVVPEHLENVVAFDTGPANALIDAFARVATGRMDAFDEDGRLSETGRVDDGLLADLHAAAAPFLDLSPPKSAGYDAFGPDFARAGIERHAALSGPDLVRTAVAFTAETLARAYERWVVPGRETLREIRVTGGGARNPTLLAEIRRLLAALGLEVVVPDDAWVDAKEAVAFALLADAAVLGRPSNVPGATGADRPVVLGKISL